jgi:protein gp37
VAVAGSSDIQWTDATWNPVRGCDKVSPGCANCYAETFSERFRGVKGHPYEQGFDFRLVPEQLEAPLRWKKPRRIFVNSMSDLFHEKVPDSYLDEVFAVMGLASQHTFQVLTKRADRMLAYMQRLATSIDPLERAAREMGFTFNFNSLEGVKMSTLPWPIPNVWLGVSAENQRFAGERIPLLQRTAAVVRFVSLEPLLGPIDLRGLCDGIDWVIVGGESGPGARMCNIEWIRAIVRCCRQVDLAVFVKQLGAKPVEDLDPPDHYMAHPLLLDDRKGGDMAEWPDDLRVREYPDGTHTS